MPKIDLDRVPVEVGSGYPAPFKAIANARARQALGDAGGLTQFGVNLTRLPPGAASAQRHWHEAEDELVFVVSGELVLVEEGAETPLRAGEAATFKAGHADGHHLVNRSAEDAVVLEIGTRASDERGHYPDIDLIYEKRDGKIRFTNRAGEPYD
jgi:uncharacterized cupin superfamily protein